ncbi:hypothetical protein BJX99DRAFT_256557 [Aspergillus californicus]
MAPSAHPQIKRLPATTDATTIFETLQTEGVLILENFLSQSQVTALNNDVNPLINHQRNNPIRTDAMKGSLITTIPPEQKRVHNLTAVSKTFRHDILNHALMHALCSQTFHKTDEYWLASGGILDNGPGTAAQQWHRDWPAHPLLHTAIDGQESLMSFFVALTEFTEENGATQFVYRGHELPEITPPDEAGGDHPMMIAEMNPGDSLVFGRRAIHRGGINATSDFTRRALSLVFFPCMFTPFEATTHLDRRLVESMTPLAQQMIAWRTGRRGLGVRGIGVWTINMNDMAQEMGLKSDQPYEDDEKEQARGTCTSALYSATYDQITVQFNISELAATVGLSVLSLFYGRRPIYLVSLAVFTIWLIPCALANNLATMMAGDSSADSSVRSSSASPAGNQRWCFYVIIIWSFTLWILCLLFMQETYAPVLLQRRVQQTDIREGETHNSKLLPQHPHCPNKSMSRPFLLLSLEPMVLCLCIYSADNRHAVSLLRRVPLIFAHTQLAGAFVGCLWIRFGGGIFVGLLGCSGCAELQAKTAAHANREEKKAETDGDFLPEFRLPPAILVRRFVLVWLEVFLAFQGIITFLVDAYPLYAASALAVNAFLRSIFAAAFPLFGDTNGQRLLAFMTVAMLPFPYIFFRYGPRFREESVYGALR